VTQGFRLAAEREIHRGEVIRVTTGTFVAPDGTEFDRDLVHHPGAVSVVPLVDDETALLVRQYRAAIDSLLLEIPAGKRDVADEPAEVTAHRELQEEIGMAAGRVELLGEFFNSPGFCDEHSWVFLARDLHEVDDARQGVEEQHMTIERVRLDDVPRLIRAGELRDAKSIIGLLLARERLGFPPTP
jgi:ADP-ribose pyrophosphatase